MNIGILKSKCNLGTTHYGSTPLLMTLQQEDESISKITSAEHKFIPFIHERDRMNRLYSLEGTQQKKQSIHEIESYQKQIKSEKWVQNNPVKSKLYRCSIDEQSLRKSKSNIRLRLIQAATDRQSLIAINNTNNTQDSQIVQDYKEYKKKEKQSKLSPSIRVQQQQQLNKYNQKNSLTPNKKQKHFLNFKLPSLIQKEYVKQFLENNTKVKQLLQEQNEIQYRFPQDFEPKLLDLKKQLKKMKSKLQNWGSENNKQQ